MTMISAGGRWSPSNRAHRLHRLIDVREKSLESFAQIVEPLLTVGSPENTVFGTTAVAHEPHRASTAIARQGIALVPAEPALLRRRDHVDERTVAETAQLETRLDKVIARV